MDILGFKINFSRSKKAEVPVELTKEMPQADVYGGVENGYYRNLFSLPYDGEKNLGEVGPVVKYTIDYDILRLRSWQSLIESPVTQTIISRFCTWVIGGGLKLTSEPADFVLKQEGITINKLDFSKTVEQRFNLSKDSTSMDNAEMETLDELAWAAYLNSIVGGDVLVILRYDGENVTVQLVDGCHVKSPSYGSEFWPQKLENGNEIINGIEFNKNKKHVRYYVQNKDLTYTTVEAVSKSSGLKVAFLIKGMGYRLDNVRGLPLLAVVLEKLKKMERYESATLSSAEERQKVAFTIEHSKNSTEENPFLKQMAQAANYSGKEDLPEDAAGIALAKHVAASMNKQVFNMPRDSKMTSLESKNELYFKDFYNVNINEVCAALNIPFQVALSLYEGNFSASRAALKDWENTLTVVRKKFTNKFYKPIFAFWLETQIYDAKIKAPGYIKARLQGNSIVAEAYRKCRFVGNGVPHIDPVKEVAAIRSALGRMGQDLPLITLEEATERLYGSESHDNLTQYSDELKSAESLGIKMENPPTKEYNPIKKAKNSEKAD